MMQHVGCVESSERTEGDLPFTVRSEDSTHPTAKLGRNASYGVPIPHR